jgi:hypothetical protein
MKLAFQAGLRQEQLGPILVRSSLAYLAIPYAIFCVGWLRWYWSLPIIALIVVSLLEYDHLTQRHATVPTSSPEPSPLLTWHHLIFLLLLALMWVSLSGAGGVGYQRGDWVKHESILQDLIEKRWPVVYDFYAAPVPLVYALAYYLPSALIGKLGGWSLAQLALFVWTFLGTIQAML